MGLHLFSRDSGGQRGSDRGRHRGGDRHREAMTGGVSAAELHDYAHDRAISLGRSGEVVTALEYDSRFGIDSPQRRAWQRQQEAAWDAM